MSPLSVMSERLTASDQTPGADDLPDQSLQNFVVFSSATAASIGAGRSRWEGEWVRTNGTDVPASTSKEARVFNPSPRREIGVRSTAMSGPATARIPFFPSGRRVTHGTDAP